MDKKRPDIWWFKEMFHRRDMKQEDVARRLGLPPSALSRALSGERRFRPDELVKLAGILKVDTSEVFTRAGIPIGELKGKAAAGMVPVRGRADAEGNFHWAQGHALAFVPDPGLPEGAGAVKVSVPLSSDGWTLYYRATIGIDFAAVGRLSLCETKDGRWLVALITQAGDEGFEIIDFISGKGETVRLKMATPILWIKP